MKDSFQLDRDWCDYAKLAAAILVAVSHYSTVIVINNHWSDSQFLRFWCQGGYIGVAIFFFFSGFGLMESEKKHHLGIVDFIKKRFSKVYLPVLFVSFIWIPLYYLFVAKDSIELTVGGVLYDVFWGFRDCVLWFVKILFLLYGIFCLFAQLYDKERHLIAHLSLLAGVGLSTLIACKSGYPYISVPLFGIGAYASFLKEKAIMKVPACYWLLAIMLMVCASLYVITKSPDPAHGVVNCGIVAFMLICLQCLTKFTPPHHLPTFCMSATYTIYIVHMKVLEFMVAQWGYIPFWSWAGATILVTIVVTYIRRLLKI